MKLLLITGLVMLLSTKMPAITPEITYPEDADPVMDYMVENGIFSGDEKGNLRKEDLITRGEFCRVAVDAYDLESVGKSKDFSDTKEHWAREYIDILSSHGYISGTSDTEFSPDSNITYEQAIAIILRINGFESEYPYGYMAESVSENLSFNVPAVIGQYATRFDVANLLYNSLTENEFHEAEEGLYTEFENSSSVYPTGTPVFGASGGGSSASYALDESVYDGYYDEFNTDEYSFNEESGFKSAVMNPLSTFSLDVDTASYSNLRRSLISGRLPVAGTVRTEEMVNYFEYDLPKFDMDAPFSVYTEVAKCPWNSNNLLAMVALKGKELETPPPSNLVFLVDVSGSMYGRDRLQLAQKSLLMLTDSLTENDRITLVTYAGSSDVVLDTVAGNEKEKIEDAIMSLRSGGSTNGAQGIITAYEKAEQAFIRGGNNRVIICSDGDFNVGMTSMDELHNLISEKKKSGVFLSVLGFGMGNYKDNKMELLADKGNGKYAYIDSLKEAKKVLVDDMTSTVFTIAKDVKLQVEFNPAVVGEYRLIGYENRTLATEDFADDSKDAGEMGAGDSMIAFYEIVPASEIKASDLKYQNITVTDSNEIMTVQLRYKLPESDSSEAYTDTVVSEITGEPSESFRFASSVAELSLILNDSEFKADADINNLILRAQNARGSDEYGYRAEFIQFADLVRYLKNHE